MTIYEILQICQSKHSAPADLRDNRASILPDKVPEGLLRETEHPSCLFVVEQQRSNAI
jgi:hypothetical protein